MSIGTWLASDGSRIAAMMENGNHEKLVGTHAIHQ